MVGTYSFHNHLGSWGLERGEKQCEREIKRRKKERRWRRRKRERGRKMERQRERRKGGKQGERKKPPEGNTGKNSLASLKSNDYQVFFHPLL